LTTDRWLQIKQIFQEALDAPRHSRDAIVARGSAGDPELRAMVESMLEHAGSVPSILDVGPQLSVDPESPTAPGPFEVGNLVAGRFEVIRHIGRGGMGEVYEAADLELGRQLVALKTVIADLTWSVRSRERFQREVRLARQVSHPNVCRINDIYRHQFEDGPDAGRELAVLSMELLGGPTLSAKLRQDGALPRAEWTGLALSLAGALEAVHAAGVVHGDLKPSNVILAANVRGPWRPVITDFGLACPIEEAASALPAGGTPSYMAPEQLQGSAPSPASDIYSFGLLLYYAFTGSPAFPPMSTFAQAREERPSVPPSPRASQPDFPRLWERVILRCLAADPTARYSSFAEIQKVISGSRTRRNVLLLVGSGLGLGVAVSRVFERGTAPGPGAERASLVVMPFVSATGDPDWQYFSAGLTSELRRMLGQVPGLRVIARQSSELAGAARLSYVSVSRRLRTGHVLAGTVHPQPDSVTVTVRIADGTTGLVTWEQKYQAAAARAYSLQLQIATGVTAALEQSLPQSSLAAGCTFADEQSYRLYTRAMQRLAGRDAASMEAAIVLFRQALQADPQLAAAWTGLAEAHELLAGRPGFPLLQEAAEAKRCIARALELCPDSTDALLESAMLSQRFDFQWAYAEQTFRQIISLNPNEVRGHRYLGGLLANLGRSGEALPALDRARDLDPLSPSAQNSYGAALLRAGQYSAAIAELERVLEMDAEFSGVYPLLVDALCQAAQAAQARRIAGEAIQRYGESPMLLYPLAQAAAAGGNLQEAEAIATRLANSWRASLFFPMFVVYAFAAARERDATLHWLGIALQEYDPGLVLLRVDRNFDGFRADPAFRQVLKKVNLA
jgi:eukaryotic-like serine/threonine-protein kinase